MEPTPISPRGMSTRREADALFSEAKYFTPVNTFTAKVATGPTITYTVNATSSGRDATEVPVLLITGLMNSKEAYAPIIDLLLDKWEAASWSAKKKLVLVAFDNRGSGKSSAPWGYYSTHTLAMDALALMDVLGWDKAHIVGPSLGGMIAQELAIAHPERVCSLNLMLTSRGRFSTKGANEFIWAMATTWIFSEQKTIEKSLEFFYPPEALTQRLRDAPETVGDVLRRFHTERMKDVSTQRTSTFLAQSLANHTHFVSDERLATLRTTTFPITIMGSADDTMIPGAEAVKLWHAIGVDRARLVYYKKAGHLVMVQCPDEVTQEIFETIRAGSKL